MERGIQSMSDAHGLCLQDFVTAGTNNGTTNDHLHNHHNLHDSVSSAVSVSSAITGLMSSGNNSLNHLSHDTSNHHHHHHSLSNTPALHEPLEKLKRKCSDEFSAFFLFRQNFISHDIPGKSKPTATCFMVFFGLKKFSPFSTFFTLIEFFCFTLNFSLWPKVKREIFQDRVGGEMWTFVCMN